LTCTTTQVIINIANATGIYNTTVVNATANASVNCNHVYKYIYKFGPYTTFNGSTINYTITAYALVYKVNVPHINVRITDIPENVSYVSNTLSQPVINGSSLEWNTSLDCHYYSYSTYYYNYSYSYCMKSFVLSVYVNSSEEGTILKNFVKLDGEGIIILGKQK